VKSRHFRRSECLDSVALDTLLVRRDFYRSAKDFPISFVKSTSFESRKKVIAAWKFSTPSAFGIGPRSSWHCWSLKNIVQEDIKKRLCFLQLLRQQVGNTAVLSIVYSERDYHMGSNFWHLCLCRVASATPDLQLSSKASPPIGWYQSILLGDRGTCVLTTCPGLRSRTGRPGFEPAACWSQVQYPNHSVTEPQCRCGVLWCGDAGAPHLGFGSWLTP